MLAARDALYQRLLDVYWDLFRELFDRPDVRAAEQQLARAIAAAWAPQTNVAPKP
jgi:hypothetical protein